MSWDSKSTVQRRRSTLSSRGLPIHTRQPKAPAEPRSAHVADPFLQSFLAPSFDPAEYLNATLPTLQTPSTSTSRSQNGAAPLADVSAAAQSQLSQLNAHTTRLTNTLTQLTDDILRSGSRLAYEVELLRGETLTLSEALSEGLQEDMAKFVPSDKADGSNGAVSDPPYITQLRTLTLVRSRLESVVKTFGDAMEFVFPPSELSVGSSFLSVSAPEPGAESHSTEEKGQQVLKKLREEIAALLLSRDGDPLDNIQKATTRIEELKELLTVWNGTAEEKGRAKFVDGLAKSIEDKQREVAKEAEQATRREGKSEQGTGAKHQRVPSAVDSNTAETKVPSGYGLMSQWQRLRTGL